METKTFKPGDRVLARGQERAGKIVQVDVFGMYLVEYEHADFKTHGIYGADHLTMVESAKVQAPTLAKTKGK